jgi:DNA-directed RNA polymerase subunit K/omega
MSGKAVAIQDYNDVLRAYDPSKNRTRNVLTRYERVKVLGIRVEQLLRGARPMVPWAPVEDGGKGFDALRIAEEELESGKTPFMLCRRLPDGSREFWRICDMTVSVP